MNLDEEEGQMMTSFLGKYRRLINPNLMFVSVDLSGSSAGCVTFNACEFCSKAIWNSIYSITSTFQSTQTDQPSP